MTQEFISLDEFLNEKNFDEIFCLVDRFMTYINFNKPKEDKIIITDKQKGLIIKAMIRSNQIYMRRVKP